LLHFNHMKKLTLFTLIISFLSLSALADQTACELSRKSLLPDAQLKKLTVKVCPAQATSDPDVYMEYDKMYESLSAQEFLVYEYTDTCYQKINSELFKSKDQDADTLQLAQQLDAILCDYPQNKEDVYRGVQLPESVVENYLKSQEITFPAFSSTSKAFHIACEFAKKGNTLIKITSKSGRAIEKQSKHEDELEIIFRLNSRFKVNLTVSGFKASIFSGCKGVSHYLELEEVYTEEEIKPFVWPH
jgi:ADP-ribosyltransferase exoenzyme